MLIFTPLDFLMVLRALTVVRIGRSFEFQNRPDMLRCRKCRRDTRLTAGTIMQNSKMSLCTWFWGAFLVTSLTPGMSALQFQKMLGIKRYETAFNMLHKLRAAMIRPERDAIGSEWPVEVDETYIGGATQGEGRGRHHKTLVAGVVEVRPRKKAPGPDPQPSIRRSEVSRRSWARYYCWPFATSSYCESQTRNA